MIEMSGGGDGQGGAFSVPKSSDDETTKNEDARVAGTETTEATKNGEDQTSAARADHIDVGADTGTAGENSGKTPNQHQHASAALLLDLAASAKSAAANGNEEGHDAAKPAALTNRQTSDPTGGGGHANFHGGMPEQSLPTHSDGMLPPHTTPPHLQHDEMPPAAFPPRFDETGSPFIHAADYAAGMTLRNNVLNAVLSELSLDGGEKVEENALANLVDEFIRGTIRLERSTGSLTDAPKKTSTAAAQAQILPVLAKDAPVIATWYNTHGDKAMSHTSKAWNEWWLMRCGHPDIGCEMIKLVVHKNDNDSCIERKEVILGLAYVERSVVDRYPIAVGDSAGSEELCDYNTESDMMPWKKRRRDDSGGGSANSRMIRTTLIRGLRINPKYNPEVAKRLNSTSNKDSSSAMHESYMGIPAALVVHVLAQSLHFGTEAVGVHCPKVDAAETFFRGLLQEANESKDRTSDVLEDEDGRKYFRLLRNNRWEVLRSAIVQQVRLSKQI